MEEMKGPFRFHLLSGTFSLFSAKSSLFACPKKQHVTEEE